MAKSQIALAILEQAVGEVRRRSEGYLGSEHLLLAVVAAAPIKKRGVDATALRFAVNRVLGEGTPLPAPSVPGTAMLSSDASKALQVAIAVAERAGREYASEEDVLLGLLDAPTAQQIVTAVLSAAGLDADKIHSGFNCNTSQAFSVVP